MKHSTDFRKEGVPKVCVKNNGCFFKAISLQKLLTCKDHSVMQS